MACKTLCAIMLAASSQWSALCHGNVVRSKGAQQHNMDSAVVITSGGSTVLDLDDGVYTRGATQTQVRLRANRDGDTMSNVMAMPEAGESISKIPADEIAAAILSSGAEPYVTRANLVRETWGRSFNAFKVFTFDDSLSGADVVHVHPYGEKEGTKRATGLNLAMIPEMLKLYPDAKWYLQADDDSLLLPYQWADRAAKLNWQKPILTGSCTEYEGYAFAVGGAGMLISNTLAKKLAPHTLECRKEFNWMDCGDARVGGCMKKVMGAEYEDFVRCLPGVSNHKPQKLDNPSAILFLSSAPRTVDVYKQMWKSMEPKMKDHLPITWADLSQFNTTINQFGASLLDTSSSGVTVCPAPSRVQSWAETCL